MLVFFKAFISVIGMAMMVFIVCRPLFLRLMSASDFAIRRNLWLAVTVAAFAIPNYWLYLLIVAILVIYAAKCDSSPGALYMMLLLALPPVGKELPTFGIANQLLFLDHLRFLSLVLLLPLALGFFQRKTDSFSSGSRLKSSSPILLADILILLLVLLQVVLVMPYISITATGKRIIAMVVDILLPYYALSRSCHTRESFRDLMAAFVMSAVLLVPMAMFETFKGWLLYFGFADHWDAVSYMHYLVRGDYLRAQVNAGHSIVLGFSFAIALGFWFSLQTRVYSANWRWIILLTLIAGLLVTFARGPWVGAVAVWIIFLRLGPDAPRRTAKALGFLVIGGIALAISPWGSVVVDNIPFIGSVGSETVEYRQRLAETSWLLVTQNPLFGSLNFLNYMEDLRQGEGIIDLVNTYATIALSYGLVGLGIFIAFFGMILVKCIKSLRMISSIDNDFALTGTTLVATLVGALVMFFTVAMYLSIGPLSWALAGMGVTYIRLVQSALDGEATTAVSTSTSEVESTLIEV